MRAVDLYSGVGGWSLGLRLAGIEVVASYERWGAANETNFKNNHHPAQTIDIRRLSLTDLPSNIDIVVGSPPCTQFSYSNRGGRGDIADGLKDIRCFLEVVSHLKPKFWVMENVPRVADILRNELRSGGALEEFLHLEMLIDVVNLEEFGLPQRRKRCFAGCYNRRLLQGYAPRLPQISLGQVLDALASDPVRDPAFGLEVSASKLIDHDPEDYLDEEERRINRAAKELHPVYNSMPFPDSRDRAARTITATCTRVSRESIIIDDPENSGHFRRLTVRERACLQGFPISFQFFGKSYGSKLKMIGNAVPPSFSYLLGHSFQGTPIDSLPPLPTAAVSLETTHELPPSTRTDRTGRKFRADRKFRFAIPSLRLKSGVRFELANNLSNDGVAWSVRFIYGNSKDIRELPLGRHLFAGFEKALAPSVWSRVSDEGQGLSSRIACLDISRMQQVWCRRGPGLTRPFMLLDLLDEASRSISRALLSEHASFSLVDLMFPRGQECSPPGMRKLSDASVQIATGLIVGSFANEALDEAKSCRTRLLSKSGQVVG